LASRQRFNDRQPQPMQSVSWLRSNNSCSMRWSSSLGHADHRQPAQHIAREPALVAGGAQAADQPLAFIEVQRRHRHPAAFGHFAHTQFLRDHCLTSTMVQVASCVTRGCAASTPCPSAAWYPACLPM
jgi:hypothetical protein